MVNEQLTTDKYAIYNADCIETMREIPSKSVHFSLYSPPFMGLYVYSSDDRDLSNAIDKDEFFDHYSYVIEQVARLTMPGRISAVHCMDIPLSNAGCDAMFDLPGEIIRRHAEHGFVYGGRRVIWKEPLMVRNRTMMKSLHHKTLCEDSTKTSIANADYLLMFRRKGDNPIPVSHDIGLLEYAGEREMPAYLRQFRGVLGDQKKNQYSQWIWRQYASSVWADIRIDRVLPFREARDGEDEKHVHPLQLDVVERACVMWSNPGEIVLSPFAGVGSELVGAIWNDRRALGMELKPTYFKQMVKNIASALENRPSDSGNRTLYDLDEVDAEAAQ